ncbi:MAG TPA: ankyrin repeat domain-containing protein [Pyrinomonadaceae bacterium]|nr:ankyrin repeat domain-containing protein [Pyrinomonadaceae bacterium]
MVRSVFILALLLFLAQHAYAQEPSPQSYLFVEVVDAAGAVVSDADVRVSGTDGKELVKVKTEKDGTAGQLFFHYYGNPHYDLHVSKAGYLTYEAVLVPGTPTDRYYARLTEELPDIIPKSVRPKGPPIKITLQRIPVTPAEIKAAELESKKRQFLLAVKRGDAATIGKLLQQGANVDWTDAKGVPAISWATFGGDPEIIKLLLAAGANVRNKDALLIYFAEGVIRNHYQINVDIIDKLLAGGVDVNAFNSFRGRILNRAIVHVPHSLSLETIKALIKAGADVNPADAFGTTPLMMAAAQNQFELVEVLLSAGAKRSLNARDTIGRSAFILAAGGYKDSTLPIVKVLLENGANAIEADDAGETPLMLAARGASNETIQILLKLGASIDAKDKQGQTVLMYATRDSYTPERNAAQTVKLLLAAGAKVNEIDGYRRSALIYSAYGSADLEVINLLIENGANVNFVDLEGQTALLLAVQRNATKVVLRLLQAGAGATINTKDKNGLTPLLYAVNWGREEIFAALIAAGAVIDVVNEKGETALITAVQRTYPNLVKLLLKAHAAVNIQDKEGNTALMYAKSGDSGPDAEVFDALIAAGAGFDITNGVGETALIRAAAKQGNIAAVRKLLATNAKATINTRTTNGETALSYAASYSDPEIVTALIVAGAKVNETDSNGRTALAGAVRRFQPSIESIKILLNAGADVTIKDNQGQTPLSIARSLPQTDILKLIEEAQTRH